MQIQSSDELTRTSSLVAQVVFDLRQNLLVRTDSSRGAIERSLARVMRKLLSPLWNSAKRGRWIYGNVYGRKMMMPAEHPIVATVTEAPLYNIPLALAVAVLAKAQTPLAIIDVGANIGETVAAIEQTTPDRCIYFCIEPEPELAQFCRLNFNANARVVVEEAFVGECKDANVTLVDDGRANPSTTFSISPSAKALSPLDRLAASFIEQHGVDLIKTDTEGYDFTILRSAESILQKYKPAVYFEWYPELIVKLNERPECIFEYLQQYGYRHWVLFTRRGELHCEISDPTKRFIEVLAKAAINCADISYFDVFGSTDSLASSELTDLYLYRAKYQQLTPLLAERAKHEVKQT